MAPSCYPLTAEPLPALQIHSQHYGRGLVLRTFTEWPPGDSELCEGVGEVPGHSCGHEGGQLEDTYILVFEQLLQHFLCKQHHAGVTLTHLLSK